MIREFLTDIDIERYVIPQEKEFNLFRNEESIVLGERIFFFLTLTKIAKKLLIRKKWSIGGTLYRMSLLGLRGSSFIVSSPQSRRTDVRRRCLEDF